MKSLKSNPKILKTYFIIATITSIVFLINLALEGGLPKNIIYTLVIILLVSYIAELIISFKKSPVSTKFAQILSILLLVGYLTTNNITLLALTTIKIVDQLFRIFVSKPGNSVLLQVLKQERQFIITVYSIIFLVTLIISICIFPIEKNLNNPSFQKVTDSIWWGFISLTTVGFGDTVPISSLGRISTIFLALMGIASFAIPASVLSSALIENRANKKNKEE
jgi:voltage-gated potassium channel